MVQYHVTLNGQGYLLDLDRYRKRIREPFPAKLGQGTVGVGDLRGPEQLLVISDWSGGEGYAQHDQAHPERWRSGSGMDVYSVPGALRVGPYYAALSGSPFDAYTVMQTYGSKIYVGSSQPSVFVWDGQVTAPLPPPPALPVRWRSS